MAADQSYSAIHDQACARGDPTYIDPETGYMVFTRIGLLERDRCCGAGCRHCPFEHQSVPLANRAQRIQQAAWLTDARPEACADPIVLFWSGGKDSFLAYRALIRETDTPVVLLTTFDARTRVIAHQEFVIDRVVEQALHLGVPLIGVPLHAGRDYFDHIGPALELIGRCSGLCFGDLHLEHIRTWREQAFQAFAPTRDLPLLFPLWKADYSALLDDLLGSDAQCVVSALGDPEPVGVAIGDRFDAAFVQSLPEGVDRFGENGEFHTLVTFGAK